jgi:hypothetical protein
LDFAREFLPDEYEEVRHIFGRRGAYRREDAVVADALDFEQSTVRAEAFNPPTFDSLDAQAWSRHPVAHPITDLLDRRR